ncbi:TetR/AcrR family transcriptional regulator [Actinomycetospora termitidis]|uniref:Helix-turn-helix domain-containing protein n=1 Tax=Actinomycetospora termitidis TaxID=3053470 RepID=A0ABT7MID3_9PSEU|nr:TetR/AcrR family transcriptional regulator [Actinomycetospora sp. Odt1-22]MDL5160400.1 helix-turn-helix domain-containing protein [Actinomycetospora sp. Odt1-22]
MTGRRDEIVEAALAVIRESGLAAFTQPRVARRTGLRQSHLTYYFPTRDELLVAVAHEAVRQRLVALGPVGTAPTAEAKVAALAAVLVAPEQTRVLLALTQSADVVPDVRIAMVELGRGLVPLAASLLTAAGAEVAPATLDTLQSTSTGIAVLALAQGGEAFRQRAEAALTALLHGLAVTNPLREARP